MPPEARRPSRWGARRSIKAASFNRDDTILFASDSRLFTIPASGGTAVALAMDDSAGGRPHRSFPQFLPDERHFIYHSSSKDGGAVRIGSLDSSSTTHLVDSAYPASYAAPYLLFVRGTTLVAQTLDLSTLALQGTAAAVVPGVVPRSLAALPVFSASGPRVLTARTAGLESGAQLEWFDRAGRSAGAIPQPRGVEYINPALSTKDDRVAVNRMDPETGNWDVWIIDNARGIQSRVTLDPAQDSDAIWSPDGKDIVFGSTRSGHAALYRKTVDSSEPEQLLAEMDRLSRNGSDRLVARRAPHPVQSVQRVWRCVERVGPVGRSTGKSRSPSAEARVRAVRCPLLAGRKLVRLFLRGVGRL